MYCIIQCIRSKMYIDYPENMKPSKVIIAEVWLDPRASTNHISTSCAIFNLYP